jgi:hypothetical protein
MGRMKFREALLMGSMAPGHPHYHPHHQQQQQQQLPDAIRPTRSNARMLKSDGEDGGDDGDDDNDDDEGQVSSPDADRASGHDTMRTWVFPDVFFLSILSSLSPCLFFFRRLLTFAGGRALCFGRVGCTRSSQTLFRG